MSGYILSFLQEPAVVIAWYGAGILLAGVFIRDIRSRNARMNDALKLAWPILIVFFSVIGFALYKLTCGSGPAVRGEEMPEYKRVFNAAAHCVAGDGIGIMTAMVVSRLIGLDFWPEFWLEYAVGFAGGWFIFQYLAMRPMAATPAAALWMAGRAEFFSMITVMLGMGLVMRFVTPAVVGYRPPPYTAAFWGFGALGLLVGYILTYPMNYWMVRIKWKHGNCGPAGK